MLALDSFNSDSSISPLSPPLEYSDGCIDQIMQLVREYELYIFRIDDIKSEIKSMQLELGLQVEDQGPNASEDKLKECLEYLRSVWSERMKEHVDEVRCQRITDQNVYRR